MGCGLMRVVPRRAQAEFTLAWALILDDSGSTSSQQAAALPRPGSFFKKKEQAVRRSVYTPRRFPQHRTSEQYSTVCSCIAVVEFGHLYDWEARPPCAALRGTRTGITQHFFLCPSRSPSWTRFASTNNMSYTPATRPSRQQPHQQHQQSRTTTTTTGQQELLGDGGDSDMMGCESDSPTPSGARPGQSGRKGSKKVRTGCITCK
jgi:hypothetical protein